MPSIELANAVLAAIMTVMNLFSGFFIPQTQIPKWWIWAYYISFVHYDLATLILNEYADNPNYANNGLQILTQFSLVESDGVTPISKYLTLLGGVVAAVLFRFIGYIALRFISHRKQ